MHLSRWTFSVAISGGCERGHTGTYQRSHYIKAMGSLLLVLYRERRTWKRGVDKMHLYLYVS